MSAPDTEPITWQIAQWVSGLTVMALGWLWRELSNKASKTELADAERALKEQHATMLERVDEHYQDAKESRERLYNKVDEINRALGVTMVSLSRLQGKLDRDEERK